MSKLIFLFKGLSKVVDGYAFNSISGAKEYLLGTTYMFGVDNWVLWIFLITCISIKMHNEKTSSKKKY